MWLVPHPVIGTLSVGVRRGEADRAALETGYLSLPAGQDQVLHEKNVLQKNQWSYSAAAQW